MLIGLSTPKLSYNCGSSGALLIRPKPSPPPLLLLEAEEAKALEEWEDCGECACGILMMSLRPGQKTYITSITDNPIAIATAPSTALSTYPCRTLGVPATSRKPPPL